MKFYFIFGNTKAGVLNWGGGKFPIKRKFLILDFVYKLYN